MDLLSYLPVSPAGGEIVVPALQPLRVYLLPGIQVDDATAGPDANMRRGSLVEYASLDSIETAAPRATIDIAITVTNDAPLYAIPASSILVVAASPDASNIYDEGIQLENAVFAALGPGDSQDYFVTAQVDSGHPAFALILSGSFRVGVRLQTDANPSGQIPARFLVNRLTAEVALVPFGLLSRSVTW